MKSINNLTHIKSTNNLSLVKTIIELSIINGIPPRSLKHPDFINKSCSLWHSFVVAYPTVYHEQYAFNTAPQSVIPRKVNTSSEQRKIKLETGLKFRLQIRSLYFLITDGSIM
jgi:hypothetical protein